MLLCAVPLTMPEFFYRNMVTEPVHQFWRVHQRAAGHLTMLLCAVPLQCRPNMRQPSPEFSDGAWTAGEVERLFKTRVQESG
jgi:hypothetical protein